MQANPQQHVSSEKKSLKDALVQNLMDNIPGRKGAESFRSFVQRRCQRNPVTNTSRRTVDRIKKKKARKVKTKMGLSMLELQRQKDKHGAGGKRKRKNDSTHGGAASTEETFLYWTDEFNEGDILAFLAKHGVIKKGEVDLHLESFVEASLRIGPKRQLGDWIEIDVDAQRGVVSCNCEDYNFDGTCFHQSMFEVLQLGRLPDSDLEMSNEKWGSMRDKCIKVLKQIW